MRSSELCYLGLGSNLEDPVNQVRTAIDKIANLPSCELLKQSSLYQSKSMLNGQPDYINAVIAIATQLSAHDLMQALIAIESSQGRLRNGTRWQARTLDIDILLFANANIKEADLVIPHYGLKQRAFVLVPLFEIAPELIFPDGDALIHYLTATRINEVIKYEA